MESRETKKKWRRLLRSRKPSPPPPPPRLLDGTGKALDDTAVKRSSNLRRLPRHIYLWRLFQKSRTVTWLPWQSLDWPIGSLRVEFSCGVWFRIKVDKYIPPSIARVCLSVVFSLSSAESLIKPEARCVSIRPALRLPQFSCAKAVSGLYGRAFES